MRALAIVLALLGGTSGHAVVARLLWSTPEDPCYLREIPGLLAAAQAEVLVALSDLRAYADGTTDPLLAALKAAKERGAAVYVLVERGRTAPAREQQEAEALLRRWGIPVRGDSPEVTLHAKFLVVDGWWVVVGSTHWTKTALLRSVQADLVLESPELAGLFRAFFFRLWEGRLSAQAKLPEGPWPAPALLPLLDLPDSLVHAQALARLLAQAEREILVVAYQVVYYPQYPDSPSTQLLGQLAAAVRRGLRVRVLLEGGEEAGVGEGNRLAGAWLYAQGVEVRYDPPGLTTQAKVLVVDSRHVVLTSANWSYAGLVKNVEAGVLFWDAPGLAAQVMAHAAALWARSRPLP